MRDLLSISLVSLLACSTAAFRLQERDNPSVLQIPIQRRRDATTSNINPVERDRQRRRVKRDYLDKRDPLNVPLDNYLSLYFANVTIGTPPQPLNLHLDTGSSDVWTNSVNTELCMQDPRDCGQSGTYNANDSSTYAYVNSDFNISYVDGSGANGDYATDVFVMAGLSLPELQFGIGYTSSSYQGILGIGYSVNTASNVQFGIYYSNLPAQLVERQVIESNVYSLWLNDLDASTGAILFGGVNTDKYEGSLQTLPVIQQNRHYSQFIIAITALGTNGNVGNVAQNQAIPAVLDSGSSLTYLPRSWAEAVFETFNAQIDEQVGGAVIDCDAANSNQNVIFTFSGVSIQVSIDELVMLIGFDGRNSVCILGILPADEINPVLGDTFLRSAYVVYDLDGNTVSLAQTNFNSTSDNIVQVTNSTGGDGIPNATPVANPVTSVEGLQTGRIAYNGGLASDLSQNGAMRTAAPKPLGAGAIAAAGLGALLAF